MPTVYHLPVELLHGIASYLDGPADLSSWTRSCQSFYVILTPLLYRYVSDDPAVLCWACDEGQLNVVQRLLDAGANPNTAWVQPQPRALTLRWWSTDPPDFSIFHLENDEYDGYGQSNNSSFAPKWISLHGALSGYSVEYFFDYFYVHSTTDYRWAPFGATFLELCYWTPLHIAAAWGNDKLVRLLLENGADINALSRLFCQCATPHDRAVAPLWTPLHTAMCHDNESTARLLLSCGASTNLTTRYEGNNDNRFTALHGACDLGLLGIARILLDQGYQADVTVRDHAEITPLAYAFFRGHWAIIDLLLEHGADINERFGGLNALGHACLLGYYAEALRLLDLGAVPQSERGDSRQAIFFHLIAVAGAPELPMCRSSSQQELRLELVNRLVQNGIDVNHRGNNGATALMEAAAFHRVEVVKSLLEAGADVHAMMNSSSGDYGALAKATLLDSEQSEKTPRGAMLNTVQLLLGEMERIPCTLPSRFEYDSKELDTSADAEIAKAFELICTEPGKHHDKSDVTTVLLTYKRSIDMATSGQDLVWKAIRSKNFEISDLLLENGFIRPCEHFVEPLISHFIQCDFAEGLGYLTKQYPGTSNRFRTGESLFEAARSSSVKCVEFMINQGASVNSRDDGGNCLLHLACNKWAYDLAEVLLKNGADPHERTQDGRLVTWTVIVDDNEDMIDIFMDYGASVHSKPGTGKSSSDLGLLDMAITEGRDYVVERILSHGKYPSATDEELSIHWQTIIDAYAARRGHGWLLDFLVDSNKFDLNQAFRWTIPGHSDGSVLTTPLHMCATTLERLEHKLRVAALLIEHGADIHKLVPMRPEAQRHTIEPEYSPKGGSCFTFEGTPLGWAIEFSSSMLVRLLLEAEDSSIYKFATMSDSELGEDLKLLYVQAACRRQRSKVFFLLFKYGLDPNICDEDGNTSLHMICDHVEGVLSKEGLDVLELAESSALCLVACLECEVSSQQKNKKGISGADRVLRMMNYSGHCPYRQALAKTYRANMDCTNDPTPRLTAKHPDSDEEDADVHSDGEYIDVWYHPELLASQRNTIVHMEQERTGN